MANTALKFFRGTAQPASQLGAIWFDTNENRIKVCVGTTNSKEDWEVYGSNVQDVTFEGSILTINKLGADPIVLNFSDVASAKETLKIFAELESSITDVDTKVNTLNTKVDTLNTRVGDIPEGATATTVVGYIDEKVKAAGDAATEELGKEVDALEKALADEATTARAAEKANADAIAVEKGRVDTLVGEDADMSAREIVQDEVAKQLESEKISDSFDTLKEMAEWLSSHPDDVQEMNDAITALQGQVGEGTVDSRIDAAKQEIVAEIEKNEEVTAEALTDLNTRVEALEGQDEYVKATVDQQIATAEQNAKDYADGLAGNYDAAGSAAAALEDANEYTDEKIAGINSVIGVKEGEGAPSGLYKEIADAAAAAQSGAEATAAGALETFVNGDFKDLQDEVDAIAGDGGSLAETLEAAKKYTDDEIAETVGVAASEGVKATGLRKEIADAQKAAETYADGLNTAMDERVDALEAAKDNYVAADTALETLLKAYADQAETDAVTTANGYTDGKIAAEVERADAKYEEKGVATGLVEGLTNGAVKDNANAIAALKSDLEAGAGMFWASFE